jgi:hypothetical protein
MTRKKTAMDPELRVLDYSRRLSREATSMAAICLAAQRNPAPPDVRNALRKTIQTIQGALDGYEHALRAGERESSAPESWRKLILKGSKTLPPDSDHHPQSLASLAAKVQREKAESEGRQTAVK